MVDLHSRDFSKIHVFRNGIFTLTFWKMEVKTFCGRVLHSFCTFQSGFWTIAFQVRNKTNTSIKFDDNYWTIHVRNNLKVKLHLYLCYPLFSPSRFCFKGEILSKIGQITHNALILWSCIYLLEIHQIDKWTNKIAYA